MDSSVVYITNIFVDVNGLHDHTSKNDRAPL